MFKTIKHWLGFKDKAEAQAPVAKRPNTPAPPVRTHHVTRSAPDPYCNTVLNNPILFVDALPVKEPQQVDVANEFKVTPYEAPAARQEPVRSPEPYFVEPDRSYNSSRDCGSSYDSSSSSSDSCSSSFD